jgi:GNAT superfamily N-acetyltransferase
MTDLELLHGPLDDERLRWVSDLYGQADARYRDPAWVRHLLIDNPSGDPAHAFAMADGRAVGYCVILPMRTRAGGTIGTTGKIEAFFIEPDHRGDTVEVRGKLVPLAMAMLRELYDFAETHGMGLLHSYSTPELGRLHRVARLKPFTMPAVMRATILRPGAIARDAASPRDRAIRLAGGIAQRAWLTVAGTLARAALRQRRRAEVLPGDVMPDTAFAAADPPPGRWAISGADAGRWYATAPGVRTVALGPARALVRWPARDGDTAQVLAVALAGGGTLAAAALLHAVATATRRAGASALRWAPWDGPDTAAVERAAQLLGFAVVERELTLYCRASAEPFTQTDGFVATPFIYAIF